MPRKRLQDVQPGFASGLVRDPINAIGGGSIYEQPDYLTFPPDGLTGARHARITAQGALQRMYGSRRLHPTAIDGANAIRGGFSWRKGDGNVQQLVTTDNLFTGVYTVPTTLWTSRAGALDNTKYHSFAAFRDGTGECVYIADGGLLNKWTGAAVSVDLAGTPSVAQLVAYNQRLYGISTTDQTLYWSALNNGDSLGVTASGGGSAVVRTFGGQQITALAVVGGSLLLFHANAISRFTGYSQTDINIDAGAIGHASGVGTLAPRSVVVVNIDGSDVALFLTKQGLFLANEGGVAPVPSPFNRDLGDYTNNDWYEVHAVHHPLNREVWFNIKGLIYVYQYDLKAWMGPHGSLFAAAGAPIVLWLAESDTGSVVVGDQGGGPILLGGGVDGFVRHVDYLTPKQDVLSDGSGGTTVAMAVQLRPWFFGDETLTKTFRYLYLTGQALGFTATLTIDWVTSTGESGSTTATLPTTFGTVAVPIWGTGTYCWISITANAPSGVPGGGTPVLAGLRGEAFALGRRR